MNPILTDEEITLIIRECARGSAINRDGSTSHRIARAIEQAILNKLSEQKAAEIEKYKTLCDQMGNAMHMHGTPFLHHELRYMEALEAWRAMK